eukprot:scaffold72128_cov22-Prasinocladus_malaysianus.AAC.1
MAVCKCEYSNMQCLAFHFGQWLAILNYEQFCNRRSFPLAVTMSCELFRAQPAVSKKNIC